MGAIFTWQTFDWEFDSAVQYRFNTKANDFEFGDQARLDLSVQYRLWPRTLSAGVPAFVYARNQIVPPELGSLIPPTSFLPA